MINSANTTQCVLEKSWWFMKSQNSNWENNSLLKYESATAQHRTWSQLTVICKLIEISFWWHPPWKSCWMNLYTVAQLKKQNYSLNIQAGTSCCQVQYHMQEMIRISKKKRKLQFSEHAVKSGRIRGCQRSCSTRDVWEEAKLWRP